MATFLFCRIQFSNNSAKIWLPSPYNPDLNHKWIFSFRGDFYPSSKALVRAWLVLDPWSSHEDQSCRFTPRSWILCFAGGLIVLYRYSASLKSQITLRLLRIFLNCLSTSTITCNISLECCCRWNKKAWFLPAAFCLPLEDSGLIFVDVVAFIVDGGSLLGQISWPKKGWYHLSISIFCPGVF